MQAYYDLFQCLVQYRVGSILLLYYIYMICFLFLFKCIYVDFCLQNANQYYRKKMFGQFGLCILLFSFENQPKFIFF